MTASPHPSSANVAPPPPSLVHQHDVIQLSFLRDVLNLFHSLPAEAKQAFDREVVTRFSNDMRETWMILKQDLGMAHLENVISQTQSTQPPLIPLTGPSTPEISQSGSSTETESEATDSTAVASPVTDQIAWMHPPWAPFPPVIGPSYMTYAPGVTPVPVVSDVPTSRSRPASSVDNFEGVDELLRILNEKLTEGESSA